MYLKFDLKQIEYIGVGLNLVMTKCNKAIISSILKWTIVQ